MDVLIAGFSTRAMAQSAVAGGRRVVTVDYFGDRDQRMLVDNRALLRDFGQPYSARALLRASRGLEFGSVVYVSDLENHPRVVAELARGRVLLGNAPAVLERVRDPRVLRDACREAEIPFPTTLLPGEEAGADPASGWLSKPVRSGGGHGTRPWPGGALDDGRVLQAYVPGRAASAAFVADGRRSVVVGLTEQLIGREELGARGFGWCGNVLPLALPPEERADVGRASVAVLEAVERMATRLTRRFGLRGVNGIDMVVADGPRGGAGVFLIEVNPRYTASMELVERAYGLNMFSLHLAAMEGRLPAFRLTDRLGAGNGYMAKGIVYAGRAVTVPQTADWVDRGRRDVPFPGERIEAGHPICTVLAQGENREACWRCLLVGARAVRREVADFDRASADFDRASADNDHASADNDHASADTIVVGWNGIPTLT